jgi:hypothetical protein
MPYQNDSMWSHDAQFSESMSIMQHSQIPIKSREERANVRFEQVSQECTIAVRHK